MVEIMVAFITGLTTGGLSCLAVQGGLLASSLSNQLEKEIQFKSAAKEKQAAGAHIARPILLFLAAKLVAYTILGFLLGMLGSVLQLSIMTRAVFQLGVGVFMVGTSLRMFNIHPIFRYFSFEPPSFITRYIRRTAKKGASSFTPLFLGTLTVLIPCGITQAMMAQSMATGNPITAATLMFSFILGTSPVFFGVAYFAYRLGSTMEKYFMRFVAVVILILGFITINTGLNLMGSPYSFSNISRTASSYFQAFEPAAVKASALTAGQQTAAASPTQVSPIPNSPAPIMRGCSMMSPPAGTQKQSTIPKPPVVEGPTQEKTPAPANPLPGASDKAINNLTVNVSNYGYEPNVLHAKAGLPTRLNLVSNNTYSCSLAFVIPSLNIEIMLPQTGSTPVDIPPQNQGTILPFSCSMGMYTGQIVYDK